MPQDDFRSMNSMNRPQSQMGGPSMARTGMASQFGPDGPSMATQTTAGGGGNGKKDTMLSRLRPPPGFDYKPYRCCFLLPHYALILIFVCSLLLGFSMVLGAITGAVFGHYIFIWFVGGLLKLVGAGMCLGVLIRPNRGCILVYLTETLMELLLALFGMLCVAMLLGVTTNQLRWRTDSSGQWLSSRSIKGQIQDFSKRIGMDGTLIVGFSFIPMAVLVAVILVQIFVIFRFVKYVENRNEYIVRSSDASASVRTVISEPAQGTVRSTRPSIKERGRGSLESPTLPRRDETWKPSTIKKVQRKDFSRGKDDKGKSGKSGAGANPPSASKMAALVNKKWQLKQAFSKK